MTKHFKKIISVTLVAVMILSTMAIATVSTSAATEQTTYNFAFFIAGSDGRSSDHVLVKVNGSDGSTDWHDVGRAADNRMCEASFTDINIGTILSISLKNDGLDGFFPEAVRTKMTYGNSSFATTFYCGKWVDSKNEVTFDHYTKLYKVTINTADVKNAGTDIDVNFTLIDKKGVKSDVINASSIHPETNAFERADSASFYVQVPQNFGELSKLEIELGSRYYEFSTGYMVDLWDCESVEVQQISGEGKTNKVYSKKLNLTMGPHIEQANVALWQVFGLTGPVPSYFPDYRHTVTF